MTLSRKHQLKADEYRVQAAGSAALAEKSVLASVREMHLRAAAAWTDMADRQDRAVIEADQRLAELAAVLAAKALKDSEKDILLHNLDPAPLS